jgi:hypothetical protein
VTQGPVGERRAGTMNQSSGKIIIYQATEGISLDVRLEIKLVFCPFSHKYYFISFIQKDLENKTSHGLFICPIKKKINVFRANEWIVLRN